MTAYAIALITETRFNDEVREYLQRIDATLAPYGGEFAIHGGPYEVKEGALAGDLVAIRFPDMAHAQAWYASPAYQAIKTLRTANTEGTLFLVNGVPPGHRGVDVLGG
ncbi:DUF1330 domain-containing protein [Massilia arenosa]|uniref:DUF1330 domain-containing protein n=1 Tax=Zemynaea arenosa TaxID=2561931 RepID=A0A4Y9RS72_9BURK|nr:DUF1330 domain-containing protein [Massilia arenosa]TFW10646.1 DUF1330 domain-containing protein [Massilia arenosa]